MKKSIYDRYAKTRVRHNRETDGDSGLEEMIVADMLELRSQFSGGEWKTFMRKMRAARR